MRKLVRQPHASLCAWVPILRALGTAVSVQAGGKPRHISFWKRLLLPAAFREPPDNNSCFRHFCSVPGGRLVASKPSGHLRLAPKYGNLPGHRLSHGHGSQSPGGRHQHWLYPQIWTTFARLHLGDSSCAVGGVLLQRCWLLLPLLPRTLQGRAAASEGLRPGCGGHRAPMAGGMLPSAGTGAALQPGEPAGTARRGTGGSGGAPGARHVGARQVLHPRFPTNKQTSWEFLLKATEVCVNLIYLLLVVFFFWGCTQALVYLVSQ